MANLGAEVWSMMKSESARVSSGEPMRAWETITVHCTEPPRISGP